MQHGKTLVSWQIDEYPHHERSGLWYIAATVAGLGLIAYALATLNFLFAFLILMFAIIMLISITRKPEKIAVTVFEEGLSLGTRFTPWREIENFSLIYDPPAVKIMVLDFKAAWRPHISISLGAQNPAALRKTLLAFIPEDLTREDEPLSDFVGRVLKI